MWIICKCLRPNAAEANSETIYDTAVLNPETFQFDENSSFLAAGLSQPQFRTRDDCLSQLYPSDIHTNINRNDADNKLLEAGPGAFLLRQADPSKPVVLSLAKLKEARPETRHYPIIQQGSQWVCSSTPLDVDASAGLTLVIRTIILNDQLLLKTTLEKLLIP